MDLFHRPCYRLRDYVIPLFPLQTLIYFIHNIPRGIKHKYLPRIYKYDEFKDFIALATFSLRSLTDCFQHHIDSFLLYTLL